MRHKGGNATIMRCCSHADANMSGASSLQMVLSSHHRCAHTGGHTCTQNRTQPRGGSQGQRSPFPHQSPQPQGVLAEEDDMGIQPRIRFMSRHGRASTEHT